MQSFNSYPNVSNMDFKISCLSVFKIFGNSSSWQTSEIRGYILFDNVSLHISKIFVSGSWQLFNMSNRFYIPWIRFLFSLSKYLSLRMFMYQVFLAGNTIPVTNLILMMFKLLSHWNHLFLFIFAFFVLMDL